MKSAARLDNHPIHPMLVTFPIGLWITGFIFHLVSIGTNAPFWFKVAQWNYFAGVIGALAAAIFGFVDYFSLPLNERQRSIATTHMLLNLVIVILFVITVSLMWSTPARFGWQMSSLLVLPFIGILGLLYSGWLGASLVHEHGVTIPDSAVSEIPGSAQARPGVGHQPGWQGSKGGEAPPPPEDRPNQP